MRPRPTERPIVENLTRPITIRVLDFETTDFPERGGLIIEAGWTDLTLSPGDNFLNWEMNTHSSQRFGMTPETRMSSAARAEHHISPAEIAGLPLFDTLDAVSLLQCEPSTTRQFDYLVAHNHIFEKKLLTRHLSPSGTPMDGKWICTMKVARRVYPSASKYSLQYLRYHANLERGLPDARCMPPHASGPDTWLTAMLLAEMFSNYHISLSEMEEYTSGLTYFHTCPMGKYKGKPWKDVDNGYLNWMLTSAKDLDPDLRAFVDNELKLRRVGR